jgi:two-component system, response regulator
MRDLTVALPDEPLEILLVEDNPNDVELTLHALDRAKLGNRIEVVRDGAEALDFLFCQGPYADRVEWNRPRLVLLDLKLPKLTGLEVLAKIRDDSRTKTLPVVVLTSSREDTDVEAAYRLGVNSYIVKPVDFDQFTDSVSKLGMYWLLMNQPPVK